MKFTTIALFLLPETNMLDLGGLIQVFKEASDFGLKIKTKICSVTSDISTISQILLTNISDYRSIKLNENDYLIIMSSDYKYIFSSQFNPAPELLNWLYEQKTRGINIGSVCNGSFLLGRANLLNNIKCTTHWKRTLELKKMFPKAIVQDNVLFVEDNGIITSAGAASGLDVALQIISKIKDDFHSHKIAREMVAYKRRSGLESQESTFLQFRNHYHKSIHNVQDYIQITINQKHSIAELAVKANMSERNFCRIFKKETSLTVFEYINCIRKMHIIEYLQNPDLSKIQIANKVGLESERQVNRILNS